MRRRIKSRSTRRWQWPATFELLVLFTSTPGFHVDVKIAEMMKDVEPEAEGGFRRTAGHRRA